MASLSFHAMTSGGFSWHEIERYTVCVSSVWRFVAFRLRKYRVAGRFRASRKIRPGSWQHCGYSTGAATRRSPWKRSRGRPTSPSPVCTPPIPVSNRCCRPWSNENEAVRSQRSPKRCPASMTGRTSTTSWSRQQRICCSPSQRIRNRGGYCCCRPTALRMMCAKTSRTQGRSPSLNCAHCSSGGVITGPGWPKWT
ncbi:MAG: hypothetical protein QOG79_6578 [Mycobacterium sp.]|nr:hypothetical protein [Mycobacterium sp.]